MIRRGRLKRSVEVPGEVLAAAPLRRDEKVLAGTRAVDGTWLLGTRDALLIVSPADEAGVSAGFLAGFSAGAEPAPGGNSGGRIAWERIERADWDRDGDRLVVSEVAEFGRVRPQHVFTVREPGLFLELLRERVSASVVLQRRVLVTGKRGLRVIGRRAPGGAGEILWAYEFEPGVDPEDPEVMAVAESALRAAEADLGL